MKDEKDRIGNLLKEKVQDRMNTVMERADCIFRTEKDRRLISLLLEEHFSEVLFLAEMMEFIEYHQGKKQTASRYRGIKG